MKKLLKNVFMAIFLIVLCMFLSRNFFDYRQKLAFYNQIIEERKTETDKSRRLQTEIVKNQDYNLVEKNIREKLNLLKENEIAIIIPKISITPYPTRPLNKPIPYQWFELFW